MPISRHVQDMINPGKRLSLSLWYMAISSSLLRINQIEAIINLLDTRFSTKKALLSTSAVEVRIENMRLRELGTKLQ
ncbi:hypothetical protein ACTXT7_013817, partial [Hymenolepis weldensis]